MFQNGSGMANLSEKKLLHEILNDVVDSSVQSHSSSQPKTERQEDLRSKKEFESKVRPRPGLTR